MHCFANYTANLKMCLKTPPKIATTPNFYLNVSQFHFAALRIESHQNCSFDYVEVWDGTRRASTNNLLARFMVARWL